MKDLVVRKAKKSDMKEVLSMIIELAKFEKSENEVQTTVKQLQKDGFGENNYFDVLIAEYQNKVCGYALFYQGYSTWKGTTLYLEDLMVREPFRNKGVGERLFKEITNIANKRKVKRLDWQVLDWNLSAIRFYKKQQATIESGWLNGRLFQKEINASKNEGI